MPPCPRFLDSFSGLDMTTSSPASTTLMANAIRALAMDAVQQANSGHPGMPMGMAEIGVALWSRHLKHNPTNPHWADRDRFVLSNGHGSMLLYSLLHLTGYDLPIEELKNFRQLHSKTPGHPEYGITPGVETTTGPLGQGLANAVGMALGEALMADEFNRDGAKIVDHHTYVFLGDGCLMEGISHEACSLAGTLKLNKLIALYDDNGISIDGDVVNWFHDDTPKRFEAYGWNVIPNVNGHDVDAVDAAIAKAKLSDKPTLICCKTVIGKGAATKAGGHDVHGAALGAEEIAKTREALGWKWEPFVIPQEVYAAWDAKEAGKRAETEWDATFAQYREKFPAQAAEFERRMANQLPADWAEKAAAIIAGANERAETVATRKASQQAIEGLAAVLPELLGGSADLTGSNLTNWKASKAVRANPEGAGVLLGNHINYGVREFGMSAALNGLALHGGHKPFGGTFLTFSDYSRNALRVAALMKVPTIFVFTHDSIGLGEDGPTHQSIEHVSSLRLIPNLDVWRPADTVETANRMDPRRGCRPSVELDLQPPEPRVQPAYRCADREHREGRLRAEGLGRRDRRAQDHPDRDGLGSRARDEGRRAPRAAGHRGPRRVDAVDQRVRSPGRRIPRTRAAARRAPRRDRSGRDELLAQVRRPRRRRRRDRHVR